MNNEVVSSLGDKAFAEPATAAVSSLAPRPVIEIDDLHVQFVTSHGTVRAVEGLSYSVHPGEMVAIVGEFGLRQVGVRAGRHAAAAARHGAHPGHRSASTAASCWSSPTRRCAASAAGTSP